MEPTLLTNLITKGENILGTFSGWPWEMLGASFAIGFITMTIIEGMKPYIRKHRFKSWVETWLKEGYDLHYMVGGGPFNIYDQRPSAIKKGERFYEKKDLNYDAGTQLKLLATGGDDDALYRLPVENLCGQLLIAVQAALDKPVDYNALLVCCINRSLQPDVLKPDLETLFMQDEFSGTQAQPENYLEAKNRISNYIQRNIDRLQINIDHKWKKLLWHYSLGISFFLTLMICLLAATQMNALALVIVVVLVTYEAAFFAGLLKRLLKLTDKNN